MSIDYDLACEECREVIHIGQIFSFGWTFGYGRYHREAEKQIGDFIEKHIGHNRGLEISEDPPESYKRTELDSAPDTGEIAKLKQRLKELE